MSKITLEAIAIAPKIMEPMEGRDSAEVSIPEGIAGDARGRKKNRQITILFADDWHDAITDADALHLDWMARRANLLVSGMRSPQEAGGVFAIGDAVRLEVALETDPCDLMEATAGGLRRALTPDWRGGVCCRVLAGGVIRSGDAVSYTAP